MASTAAVLLCFLTLYCIRDVDCGVCSNINYTTISNVRRSTAYTATSDLCDRDFIQDGTWYRFKSVAGDKMPEFNPGINHCGTFIPIWMKGKHPSYRGQNVNRIACAAIPWKFPAGCGQRFDIKVLNCGSFFLYQLKEPQHCTYAYCAGSNLQTNCSSDGTSLPVCPGVVPIIRELKAKPKNETREFVALTCIWKCRDNSSLVEFHVRWFRDSNHTSPAVERKLSGTATKSSYEDVLERQNETDAKRIGYQWNKMVFCEVRAKFRGGKWSAWKSSNTIFTGIVVYPKEFHLSDCEGQRKEVFLTLRPHLPLRGRPFKFEIQYNGSKSQPENICIRGKVNDHNGCVTKLTKFHSVDRPLRLKIIAVCPRIKDDKRGDVEVKFQEPFYSKDNNIFWMDYDFPFIKISINASNSKFCSSETDPNIVTFDGRKYNPRQEGTFRLYRNRLSGTEVQTRLDVCCNCGVAIKEGYYFKIVELCSSIQKKDKIIIAKTKHTPDMVRNGFYTEKPLEQFTAGRKIIVHLPSGIKVTIKRSRVTVSSLDIKISAPEPYPGQNGPNDMYRHSEGLCGNFNGDPDDDFEGWSDSEFYDRHRIQSGSKEDIFAYKGDEKKQKELYDACMQEEICSCKIGPKNEKQFKCDKSNPEVMNECFPTDEDGQISKDFCDGSHTVVRDINRRRRRALDSRNDDIDDQDDIPPYNPPIRKLPVPSWPTGSGLTEQNVTEICNAKIRFSDAGKSCGAVEGVDLDLLVNQCVSDIKLTDDLTWAVANFGALSEVCRKNVYKNITYYKKNTGGKLKLETTVLDSLCPNDCSDRGNCSNSTCTCAKDYTGADCSVSVKDRPILYAIRNSGLCDLRRRPCQHVGIYAFPLLDSENLTCHIQEFKVTGLLWTPDSSILLYPGLMVDINEVKCLLPESPVNIGDYPKEGITTAGLKIAVSNNRINASNEAMLFITYDSVCQKCNTTTGCQLKKDACFISGHCFAESQSNPNDWCQQCLPSISTKSWAKRKVNRSPKFIASSVFYTFLGKELRVTLSAIDPENRTIRYSFARNGIRGASLKETGLFTWTKNTSDSTTVMFKVTDECGAYSILNASVVIKECPCQNSGECLPNYHHLDGAGNFICLCPPGYTNTLCEVDVNECIVSKPCMNGRCNNKSPGFSCSCFAGYTGHVCDTEIDECASNPCFVGLRCTDMVNSFNCDPCPGGYSGDGVNCTRLDGKMDECIQNPLVCHTNAKCVYSNRSYVCRCEDSYTGDGKNNCIENRPPQFTTPSSVYAILNDDFQIQIMVKDSENKNMTFTLLPNGTLSATKITQQVITISAIKKSGTLYIQVENEMGAKNILIVRVIVIKCPCAHHGKCYKNKTIPYAVHPSDYLCQCEKPYTGNLCQTRSNPCNEQPCYPGLKCLSSQNSDGFTCEKCPPLFEGDGKQCKVLLTQEKNSVLSEFTLTNQKWDDELKEKTSEIYSNLAAELTVQILNIYSNINWFSYVIIKGFSQGSVIVKFELIFTKKVDDPLKPLEEVAKIGKLGNMTIEMKIMKDKAPDGSYNLWLILGITAIALIMILIISVVVCILKKRRRQNYTVSNRKQKRHNRTKTQELTDIVAGEQIGLEVLDNENTLLVKEIKIQT